MLVKVRPSGFPAVHLSPRHDVPTYEEHIVQHWSLILSGGSFRMHNPGQSQAPGPAGTLELIRNFVASCNSTYITHVGIHTQQVCFNGLCNTLHTSSACHDISSGHQGVVI
jgi:hypothetical protein